MSIAGSPDAVMERFAGLRQHQVDGRRSPHKPLLVLAALGRLASTGSSRLRWSEAETVLADLIAEFGTPSTASRRTSAAYPFTRLRSDLIWQLDRDVPMDNVGPLDAEDPVGSFVPEIEHILSRRPQLLARVARAVVDAQFPATIAPDVLATAGLDPEAVLRVEDLTTGTADARRRDPRWRNLVLRAWDRQCAFCGYDGQIGSASAGIDAAHVRWFAFDGPDDLDNGLALCALHHKLFDLGVLGLRDDLVQVSVTYSARTESGRAIYDLHNRRLRPRPGTEIPSRSHVEWHREQVFKDRPLAS